MCIIVHKPTGIDLPTRETLARCFRVNRDGAGFMYLQNDKKVVRSVKGFMSFEDFWAALNNVRGLKETELVMHFRIGTQGHNDAANCHPFPISTDKTALTARQSVSEVALVHNGIIPLTTSWNSYKSTSKESHSDTFYFVRDYASLIIDGVGYWKDANKVKLLERLAESKLCILGTDGHVERIGEFEQSDGCYFSNGSYRPIVSSIPSYVYDDEEWETLPSVYTRRKAGKPATFAETISAAFIPNGVNVYDWKRGAFLDAQSDNYVHDKEANVYLYDGGTNLLMHLPECTSVDDSLDPVYADKDMVVHFYVEKAKK